MQLVILHHGWEEIAWHDDKSFADAKLVLPLSQSGICGGLAQEAVSSLPASYRQRSEAGRVLEASSKVTWHCDCSTPERLSRKFAETAGVSCPGPFHAFVNTLECSWSNFSQKHAEMRSMMRGRHAEEQRFYAAENIFWGPDLYRKDAHDIVSKNTEKRCFEISLEPGFGGFNFKHRLHKNERTHSTKTCTKWHTSISSFKWTRFWPWIHSGRTTGSLGRIKSWKI